MWVFDRAEKKMGFRTIQYVPGLYKIFDEILVNAADNYRRDGTQNTIRVDIDAEQGTLRVYNNGAGVPVEMHKEEGVYVPERIFGHLLTSSNYDDDERKATAYESSINAFHPWLTGAAAAPPAGLPAR